MSNNFYNDDIRKYIKDLKSLYTEIFVSGCIFLICVIAWVATGGGFWPLWVLLAFSIKIFIKAFSIGKVSIKGDFFNKWFSFLSPDWEEKQFEKYSKVCKTSNGKSENDSNSKNGNNKNTKKKVEIVDDSKEEL